jgi:hypothetical protein
MQSSNYASHPWPIAFPNYPQHPDQNQILDTRYHEWENPTTGEIQCEKVEFQNNRYQYMADKHLIYDTDYNVLLGPFSDDGGIWLEDKIGDAYYFKFDYLI